MLQRAQDMFRQFQDRMKVTLQTVADFAESVGVPPAVTAIIHREGRSEPEWNGHQAPRAVSYVEHDLGAEQRRSVAPVPRATAPVESTLGAQIATEVEVHAAGTSSSLDISDGFTDISSKPAAPKKRANSKSSAKGKRTRSRRARKSKARDVSDLVRPLKADHAINGSTYLARIIWSLGVSAMEGTGPLRPADVARMVMARSPVSLEPPNVARYIRRSKPECLSVAYTEGSSNYYKLNAQGKRLFEQHFGLASSQAGGK